MLKSENMLEIGNSEVMVLLAPKREKRRKRKKILREQETIPMREMSVIEMMEDG